MDTNYINDEEVLYRAIPNKMPNAIVNGKILAAVFIDNNGGTSVDRDGGRTKEEITETLKKRFNRNGKEEVYLASASLTARQCRDAGAYPTPCASRKNAFHAEIHESATEECLSLAKAMLLSMACVLHA